MITVSVIIPAFNHAQYVAKAVQSVLDQTFTDFELLISDDCSDDETLEVLKQFEKNPRVTVFKQEKHIGAVEQIHYLAQHASGKYIALLNSDDFWFPEKLAKQVAFMENHQDIDACFTHAVMVDEAGCAITERQFAHCNIFLQPNRSRPEWLSYFLKKGNALAHPSVLARRGLYEGPFRLNAALRQLPDYDLWTRLVLQHREIYVLQEVLTAHRRIGKQNTSAQTAINTAMLYREQAWIRSNLIENLSETDFLRLFRKPPRETLCGNRCVTCEKYFVLLQMGNKDAAMLERAIDYFVRHAESTDFMKQMRKQYGYSDKDFFEVVKMSQIVRMIASAKKNESPPLRNALKAIYRRLIK